MALMEGTGKGVSVRRHKPEENCELKSRTRPFSLVPKLCFEGVRELELDFCRMCHC
jgi:hypothetical protein